MSFRILEDTIKSSVYISQDDYDYAFNTIKFELLKKENLCHINIIEVKNSKDFEELINAMKWDIIFDAKGNTVALYNHGLNVAEEECLFTLLAPYIKNGSFIEYEREGYNSKQKERFEFTNSSVKHSSFSELFDNNDKSFWE